MSEGISEDALRFFQKLAEIEEHTIVQLAPDEWSEWDQDPGDARDSFRRRFRNGCAEAADEDNSRSVIVHTLSGEIVCLAVKDTDAPWEFVEVDGERVNISAVFMDE